MCEKSLKYYERVLKMETLEKYHSSERGFSLVELLVVLALIGAILVIGVPALVSQRAHQRLTRAARDMATELNAARIRAITKNTKYRVAFTLNADPTPDTYNLQVWDTALLTWGVDTSRATTHLPNGIDINSLVTQDAGTNIDFYPNGSSNTGAASASICLANTADAADKMKVTVQGSTGMTTVVTGGGC